jgi:lipid-binding SYLF domain-containing protein
LQKTPANRWIVIARHRLHFSNPMKIAMKSTFTPAAATLAAWSPLGCDNADAQATAHPLGNTCTATLSAAVAAIPRLRRVAVLAVTAVLAGGLLGACTTTPFSSPAPQSSDAAAADTRINADVTDTLNRLYTVAAGARNMVSHAAGVLVFPKVYGGALIIGAEHGQGALQVHGRTAAYYNTTGASIGWQAGASSKAVIYVFNTAAALQQFRDSNGWQVGADARVAVGHVGANGSIDSQTLNQPVVSFVMNNAGVEGGVSVDGSKITRVAR